MCWNCRNCLSKIKHCLSPKWSALILDDEMALSSKSHIPCFSLTPPLPTFWESSVHENQYHKQHQKSGPPNPLRRGRLPREKDIHCGEDGWDSSGDLCLQTVSGEEWGLLITVRALWETGRHAGVLEECCRNQLLTVILKMLLALLPQMCHTFLELVTKADVCKSVVPKPVTNCSFLWRVYAHKHVHHNSDSLSTWDMLETSVLCERLPTSCSHC